MYKYIHTVHTLYTITLTYNNNNNYVQYILRPHLCRLQVNVQQLICQQVKSDVEVSLRQHMYILLLQSTLKVTQAPFMQAPSNIYNVVQRELGSVPFSMFVG